VAAAERCKQCNKKVSRCGTCKGTGRQPDKRATCPVCNGTKYDCPEHGKYWR